MTERRQSARYSTAAWIYYLAKTGNKGGPFQVVNASDDGLYLATEERPKMGTALMIEVVVEGRTLMVVGEVVRHIDAPRARRCRVVSV